MSEPTLNNSQISASTSFVSSTSDSTSASRVPAEPMKAEGPREEVKPVFMLERAGPGIKRYKSPQASLCLFEGDKKVVEEIKAEMERIVDEAEANEATSTSTSPRHRSIKGTPKLESQPGSVHSDTFDLLEPTNGPQKTPQGGTGYKSSFRSLGATDGPQKTPQGGTGYKSSFRSLGATSGPQSDAAAIKLTDSSFDIESKCDLPSEKQRHKSYAERWEEAIKEIVIAGTLGDSENANNRRDKAYEQIATVCNDFKTAAVAYSRIIILEKRENAQNKTIPQFFCNGEIGGTKYRIFDKIFFKFSEKDKEHYKDNDSAGKVSGHEIKSASYLLSAVMNKDLYKDLIPEGGVATPEDEKKIKDKVIVPPLMVLIDYLGYRIIAMPVLPVGKITKANNETESTLIYGSNDALQTFKNDESIDAELEKICKELNIKKHTVQTYDGVRIHNYKSWLPFDLEVHRSSNPQSNSLYFLDLSRLFPATVGIDETIKGTLPHLYKLMRSELLKTSEVPISSDWPNAGSSDPKGFEAAKKLIARLDGPGDDILPFTFADRLAGMPIDVYSGDLVLLLHMAGINVRFMGLVYRRLRERHPNSDWCCRVATEILARSFRKVVNNELRTCTANTDGLGCGTAKFDFSFSEEAETTEGDGEYIDENVIAQIITYCLNNFFTKSSESADLMNAINKDITNRFVFKNTEEKEYVHRFTTEDMVVRPDGSDIESYKNGIPTFMLLTTEFFNLEWYNDVWNSFMKGGKEFFSGVAPFHHRSLKGIMPRVKEMNIAHHSNGIAMEKFYFTFKKQKRTKAIAIPRYIFNSVTENFRLALFSMPSNSNSLRRYAKALSEELENIADDDSVGEDERARREKLRSKLDAIYTRIARDNTDYSLYYAAVYYDKKGDIKTARDLYRRSLEINPTQGNCYLMCADTLTFPSDKSLADTKEGKKLYLEGIKKDDMGKLHNNLAVLYYNEGNIAEAGEHLCIALEKALKHSTGVTGENCLAFCKYVLGDEELYKKMYKFIGNHNKKFKI